MSEPYWEPLAAAVASGACVKVADVVLGADAATIDIANIPQGYDHLLAIFKGRTTAGAPVYLQLRLNNDSGANYDDEFYLMRASPSNFVHAAGTAIYVGTLSPSGATAGVRSLATIEIPFYADTSVRKQLLTRGFNKQEVDGNTAEIQSFSGGGEWRSTAAVNRITLLPSGGNFVAGSRLVLYALTTSVVSGGGGGGASLVTSLPGSPFDGQEIVFTDSLTAPTYQWHLRYLAATGKWHFLGGAPFGHEIATEETTSAAGYVDLATPGPLFTIPVAGIYDLAFSSHIKLNVAATIGVAVKLGAAAAADADAALEATHANLWHTVAKSFRRTLAAADIVKLQYSGFGGATNVRYRVLYVTPVRLG